MKAMIVVSNNGVIQNLSNFDLESHFGRVAHSLDEIDDDCIIHHSMAHTVLQTNIAKTVYIAILDYWSEGKNEIGELLNYGLKVADWKPYKQWKMTIIEWSPVYDPNWRAICKKLI